MAVRDKYGASQMSSVIIFYRSGCFPRRINRLRMKHGSQLLFVFTFVRDFPALHTPRFIDSLDREINATMALGG